MITIIAGSRSVTRYKTTLAAIEACSWRPTEVVCGLCPGPDMHGKQWAERNKVKCRDFPANWVLFGNRAGMMRNNQMALHAEALIAVWDGVSPGTCQMIEAAQIRKLRIFVYNPITKETDDYVF